ncbi:MULTISPECIES: hypothetical protein [Pantoea]|uniref:Uncharacterized protein n=2 Tax=Pantoea stewartii TaxID=66269 RepID=H3RCZ7_PANSE|nr:MULTISPECIES: hypothetical protein [Pantoea]KKW49347.1 hypothetical protein XB02_18455 [Pantoea ananatis]ARF50354.1 hypothetical protein DSJ_14120 [Pantoea stewartii subsp. stewartii DC283]EHU00673.1 hypothetical protein CKS_2875 [Pantoea stewartii subsp. stewartii DC283]KAB0558833.1 hypothetical protein F7Q90_03990 [Pantoea stewartii subsp. stewartii]KGD81108.1 hypothetical protein HA47_19390 [Pantoea stewartii subsp. indologenes]
MTRKWLTLYLSRSVSRVMLQDLQAILPAEAVKIFTNDLDDVRYATVECVQAETTCALIASAIIVWRQLGHIHLLLYTQGEVQRQITDATQFELFTLLKNNRAALRLA